MNAEKNVLIVGGGTAGWLCACFLAKTLGARDPQAIRITLVESPEIGTIGVGEGSFPSLRGTLAAIGIEEARFIRDCQASFKQGIQFVDWVHPPGETGSQHYFHPFNQPSQRPGGVELLPYWLQGAAGDNVAFAEAVSMQKRIADASRAPKRFDDKDFLGPMNYAYHFDAGRFARLLSEHGRSLGVHQILATVQGVELAEDGAIAAVKTSDGTALHADLYIDCSGFRALLIGEALGEPLHTLGDTLFVDRALALQVPYPGDDANIPSYTMSTAREAGWIWDIGLQDRRGLGYVYSSRHLDDTQAERQLRAYAGFAGETQTARLLKLQLGYRHVHWKKNCVAVGLSGGFIEPLEASGIGLVETAAYLIAYLFPFQGNFAAVAKTFNQQMQGRYERIVDFVKMHYCLTQRTDSAFWIDNANPDSIPDSLKDKLAMWRSRPPHRLDFITDLEMYPPSSWQYVLYGMQFKTEIQKNAQAYPFFSAAQTEFKTITTMAERALHDLPSHRVLLQQMCRADAITAPARFA